MTAQAMENFLQALTAGLLVGAIYGMMCVGLAIIFGVMRVINFAHGDFMMLGMYAAYYLLTSLGLRATLGVSIAPYAAALLAGPTVFLIGYALHAVLISKVSGMRGAGLVGDGQQAQLILTLGIALVLSNGGLILFGSSSRSLSTPLATSAWEMGPLWGGLVSVFINKSRTLAAIISAVITVALWMLVRRSRTGKALRAAADNPIAASYMGIDVDRSHRLAFGLGVGITAVAGGLLATSYPFQPYVGFDFVIIMFAGVVLGGLGSIAGAFWGGMTIGLIQQLSALVLPTQLQNTSIFILFLLVIFLRPQGFFGRVVERT
jgi:branched-chain amino acid transport system permease protein